MALDCLGIWGFKNSYRKWPCSIEQNKFQTQCVEVQHGSLLTMISANENEQCSIALHTSLYAIGIYALSTCKPTKNLTRLSTYVVWPYDNGYWRSCVIHNGPAINLISTLDIVW